MRWLSCIMIKLTSIYESGIDIELGFLDDFIERWDKEIKDDNKFIVIACGCIIIFITCWLAKYINNHEGLGLKDYL